jgi:4-aminobutyrate aminotransferase-like enzyme
LLLGQFFPHSEQLTTTPEGPFEANPDILQKEQLLRSLLIHPAIKAVRSRGLLMAVQLPSAEFCQKVCHRCVHAGVVTDWFLFAADCLRIAPPLITLPADLEWACGILLQAIEAEWQGV